MSQRMKRLKGGRNSPEARKKTRLNLFRKTLYGRLPCLSKRMLSTYTLSVCFQDVDELTLWPFFRFLSIPFLFESKHDGTNVFLSRNRKGRKNLSLRFHASFTEMKWKVTIGTLDTM